MFVGRQSLPQIGQDFLCIRFTMILNGDQTIKQFPRMVRQ